MHSIGKIKLISFAFLWAWVSFSCCIAQTTSIGNSNKLDNSFNTTFNITIVYQSIVNINIDSQLFQEMVAQEVKKATKDEIDSLKNEVDYLYQKYTFLLSQDSITQDSIVRLGNTLRKLEYTIDAIKDREKQIELRKWSYLPFGVHQFSSRQIGKGVLFAGTQIGLSVLGGCLIGSMKEYHNKLQNEPYQTEARQNELSRHYYGRMVGAVVCFTGVVASLIWNYCDNFKKERYNKDVVFSPIVVNDWRGNLQMGVNVSVNF